MEFANGHVGDDTHVTLYGTFLELTCRYICLLVGENFWQSTSNMVLRPSRRMCMYIYIEVKC